MWSKETPTEEGWYWMKYKNKRNTYTACPALVVYVGEEVLVRSAFNDSFMAGPNHGGPQLRYDGKIDKSIRFGDRIPEPE